MTMNVMLLFLYFQDATSQWIHYHIKPYLASDHLLSKRSPREDTYANAADERTPKKIWRSDEVKEEEGIHTNTVQNPKQSKQ